METLIVILNYRTADLTIQCLDSLAVEIDSTGSNVVVVDNDSCDDSIQRIEDAIKVNDWGNWVSLMALDENRGYAAGNNAPVRTALTSLDPPQYVLILNPDTMVRQGAIRALVDFMDKHPNVGIAGSRLEDPDGMPQCAAFAFPSLISEFDGGLRFGVVSSLLKRWRVAQDISDKPHRTDWVSGASFMMRSSVFRDVGFLDEGYFLYYEELDFCLQAFRAGWECWHVPKSRVVHLVGQSTGVSRTDIPAKRRPSYWFESRRRYFQKNYGWFYAIGADLAWMTGFFLWRIRRILQRKPDKDPPHMFWDFFRHSSLIHREKKRMRKGGSGL